MECKKLFDCIDFLYEEYLQKWVELCNLDPPHDEYAILESLKEAAKRFAAIAYSL